MSTPMNNLRKETEHGNSDVINAASKLFNFKKKRISDYISSDLILV